jgi:hypothetical protein
MQPELRDSRPGAVDGGVVATGDFVHRPESQPAAGEEGADGFKTERTDRARGQRRARL